MACVIMDAPATPAELLALQLVENLVREDLKPIEHVFDLTLVLAESMLLAIIGGGLGLAATYFAVGSGSFNNALLPVFIMRNRDVVIGLVLCCALGLVAGSFPAIMAMRLRITDALRRT